LFNLFLTRKRKKTTLEYEKKKERSPGKEVENSVDLEWNLLTLLCGKMRSKQ